jgi:hypothetical protein
MVFLQWFTWQRLAVEGDYRDILERLLADILLMCM